MSDLFLRVLKRTERRGSAASTPPFEENEASPDRLDRESVPDPAPAQALTNEEMRQRSIGIIEKSGLFHAEYYLRTYPDVGQAAADPLSHFFDLGHSECRLPNPYFDTRYYLENNPVVHESRVNPLLHYALLGDLEGHRPSAFFDPNWYRSQHGLSPGVCALSHYLANCRDGTATPHPDFDAAFYASTYPDVAAAGIDLFQHFINSGVLEGRAPSAAFDPTFYVRRYLAGQPEENPFFHWVARKHQPGIYGKMPADETTIPREVKAFTRAGHYFEEFHPLPASTPRQAKVLALYLPQFHAVPENDLWWGKGFTEWTNISRGLPRFKGHYQPRIPRDLGHYSLELTETMRRQAAMAQAGGVHGFVFYYYWFNGKRLLEKPIDRLMTEPSIDIPFCLMWANENWTRRWDGLESEVLISQDYREADDERMIAEFSRYIRDPRYIRLSGNRPLVMIYRPRLIPDANNTIRRWRAIFRDKFAEDPILVMAQGFGDADPDEFGLDGAMEFPPHKLGAGLPLINKELALLDADFSGHVFRYSDVVKASLAVPLPSFPLIKGAMPSWDNDARRQGTGMVIHGATPPDYEAWLTQLIKHAGQHTFFGERLVCVNAWNEWAEGAYLEPDQHFGAAFLNATARAVAGLGKLTSTSKLLLIGHDAHAHGAQELLLHIGRTLTMKFGVQLRYILLDGGAFEAAYAKLAPVTVARTAAELEKCLAAFKEEGFDAAIVNTSAAARTVKIARTKDIRCINLVHELPRLIAEHNLGSGLAESLRLSSTVVFPSTYVRDTVLAALNVPEPEADIAVKPQGVYKPISFSAEARRRVQEQLNIAPSDAMVLGVGYADLRKGFDLFLQAWKLTRTASGPCLHFCWIGKVDPSLRQWLAKELDFAIAEGSFHLPGFTDDLTGFISAASVIALTSREDPFPSVVLEALSAGVPVVAFADAGGIAELLTRNDVGKVVPYCDARAMARALRKFAKQRSDGQMEARRDLMASSFDWGRYVRTLLDLAIPGLARVSVAVPNYNYERYMAARLSSIFAQDYPIDEVLVLDDCSKDDSLRVIAAVAEESGREIRLIPNESNSGSVFAQWRKAAALAGGDFVWIAEADDLADPDFLSRLLEPMLQDPSICLGFSDSRAIDENGERLGDSYKPYYAEIEPGALNKSHVYDAREFMIRFAAVRNPILNVSSVIWRRDALMRALDACRGELLGYHMAGDWRLYAQAMSDPAAKVAYEARPLNVHRRHAKSVTHALDAERHVGEIARIHSVIAGLFSLSETILDKQRDYRATVKLQLAGTPLIGAQPPRQGATQAIRKGSKKPIHARAGQ